MHKRGFNLPLWLCIAALALCTNSCRENLQNAYILNIREKFESAKEEVLLSDLSSHIEYVILEENPKVILTHINKLHLTRDFIFISNRQGLYQFDYTGKFIVEIGRKGKGPGEHQGLIRFAIDEFHNEAIICTDFGNAIIYDLESGKVQRTFDIDSHISDVTVISPDRIAFFTSEHQNIPEEVIITDREGIIINAIADPLRSQLHHVVAGLPNAYKIKDRLLYMYRYRDTLYTVSDDYKRVPYAIFKYDNTFHRTEITEVIPAVINYPDLLAVNRIQENEKFFFVTIQKGIQGGVKQDLTKMVFDKSTEKIISTEGFTNDLDGGLSFWPQWVSNGILADYHHAYAVLDYYRESIGKVSHSAEFLKMVEMLNDNSNPILVLIKN
jgi:hypothetical protein